MSCHAEPGGSPSSADTTPGGGPTTDAVLLVGNPNTGKSTLFNALTGARQRVMNAPGTTVEVQVGTWRGADRPLMDLPGTYSLIARSPDEAVVTAMLGPDSTAIVVLDATAMSRSLYLLAQVARTGCRIVAAVTMLDVASAHGVGVDLPALELTLGVPVVGLDPRSGSGVDALVRALPGRHVAGIDREELSDDLTGQLGAAEELFGWVERVCTIVLAPPHPVRRTRTDAVDRALLNPWLGGPVFLALMWALFQLTTTIAVPVMDLVEQWVSGPIAAVVETVVGSWAGPFVESLLTDGVGAGIAVVATFVPLMAIIYTALALLEDSGYLARAAFLADRLMRVIGLDGRAVLPLIIGFGCNVPALAATRTIPNARQRLLTGLLVPWTSCAARLAVYVLLAGVFFPDHAGLAVFAMYALSVVLVIGGGFALRRTAFRDVHREPLVLVLPAYQRPRLRPLAISVGTRVWSFVRSAGRIIVATLTVIWLLTALPASGGHPVGDVPPTDSVYGRAADAIAPVLAPAGLADWRITAALGSGIVAKEVVIGSLAQSYAIAEEDEAALGDQLQETLHRTSGGHPDAAAFALMVFLLGYTPCVAVIAEQTRRFGIRWAVGAAAVQLVVAWLLAVAVFQVGRLL